MTLNEQRLKLAEKNLATVQRKIRRLMTSQKLWERRFKYYSKLVKDEQDTTFANEIAKKIIAEQQADALAMAQKFAAGINTEGRMFRNEND